MLRAILVIGIIFGAIGLGIYFVLKGTFTIIGALFNMVHKSKRKVYVYQR